MIGINKKNKEKGFTLIELIVVMAVFLLIMGVALAIFISIVIHQKRILAEQELLNQASYISEYVSKALRMARKDTTGECLGEAYIGYNYILTRPKDSSYYTGIKFLNMSDVDEDDMPVCQEFYLDFSNPAKPILKEKKVYYPYFEIPDNQSVALSTDKLAINSIRFGVNGTTGCYNPACPDGAPGNDGKQPRITLSMEIQVSADNEPVRKIQTTVSQRNINVE